MDRRNTGAVQLDEILDSMATSGLPWGDSCMSYVDDGGLGCVRGQVDERRAVLEDSQATRARERRLVGEFSIAGVEGGDGKRWVRRLLEPLVSPV